MTTLLGSWTAEPFFRLFDHLAYSRKKREGESARTRVGEFLFYTKFKHKQSKVVLKIREKWLSFGIDWGHFTGFWTLFVAEHYTNTFLLEHHIFRMPRTWFFLKLKSWWIGFQIFSLVTLYRPGEGTTNTCSANKASHLIISSKKQKPRAVKQ